MFNARALLAYRGLIFATNLFTFEGIPQGRCPMGNLGAALAITGFLLAPPAAADPFFFSTGNPDGLIGTASFRSTLRIRHPGE